MPKTVLWTLSPKRRLRKQALMLRPCAAAELMLQELPRQAAAGPMAQKWRLCATVGLMPPAANHRLHHRPRLCKSRVHPTCPRSVRKPSRARASPSTSSWSKLGLESRQTARGAARSVHDLTCGAARSVHAARSVNTARSVNALHCTARSVNSVNAPLLLLLRGSFAVPCVGRGGGILLTLTTHVANVRPSSLSL